MNPQPNATMASLPKLIGLGYRARAGKDTVGAILEQSFGYEPIAFADTLKQLCYGLVESSDSGDDFKENVQLCGLTGRQLLIAVGKALREHVSPNVWIDALNIHGALDYYGRVVITDVRFPNEAAKIKELGGILIEVRRPGLPDDLDETETAGAAIKWDHTIVNAGSLEDLEVMVATLLAALSTPPAAAGSPPVFQAAESGEATAGS